MGGIKPPGDGRWARVFAICAAAAIILYGIGWGTVLVLLVWVLPWAVILGGAVLIWRAVFRGSRRKPGDF
jgi:hypothetical protein